MAAHKYWRLSSLQNTTQGLAPDVAFRGISLHTVPVPTDMSAAITAGISAVVIGGSAGENALGDNVLEHVNSVEKTFADGGAIEITITLATAADIKAVGVSWVDFVNKPLAGFDVYFSDDNVNWTYVGSLNLIKSRVTEFAPAVIIAFPLPRTVTAFITGGTPFGSCVGVLYAPVDPKSSLTNDFPTLSSAGAGFAQFSAYGPPTNWTMVIQMRDDSTKNAQATAWIYA
jgi:hypothetical protein